MDLISGLKQAGPLRRDKLLLLYILTRNWKILSRTNLFIYLFNVWILLQLFYMFHCDMSTYKLYYTNMNKWYFY